MLNGKVFKTNRNKTANMLIFCEFSRANAQVLMLCWLLYLLMKIGAASLEVNITSHFHKITVSMKTDGTNTYQTAFVIKFIINKK